MATKRVVIVGGGYAGTALARALDDAAEVVLIEPRDRFVHNVAAIRAVVMPDLLDRIALPYDRLLKCGHIVRDRAIALQAGAVSLASGGAVEGDVFVVTTGSRYARPFKPEAESVPSFIAAARANHDALRAAKSVAIVGAGAVGIELAGEIAAAFPSKKVTLVSGTPTLLPAYNAKLGRKLETQLKAMRVTLRLGAPARAIQSNDAPFAGRIELTNGETIEADIVFPAIGAKPVNDLLRAVPGVSLDALGRATVDPWLRPAGAKNLFALGDVAAAGDAMTIVAITRQQPWLTKTIKAMLGGADIAALPPYKAWPSAPILVPLGPAKGASQLPLTRNGFVVGGLTTSLIKGRRLFIPRYLKDFGYA